MEGDARVKMRIDKAMVYDGDSQGFCNCGSELSCRQWGGDASARQIEVRTFGRVGS